MYLGFWEQKKKMIVPRYGSDSVLYVSMSMFYFLQKIRNSFLYRTRSSTVGTKIKNNPRYGSDSVLYVRNYVCPCFYFLQKIRNTFLYRTRAGVSTYFYRYNAVQWKVSLTNLPYRYGTYILKTLCSVTCVNLFVL